MIYDRKLIILRGNSGSGKSTVAKKLRELSTRRIAIVEQDYIRREIFKEKETNDGVYIELMKQVVEYSLGNGYDVILEGILGTRRHKEILEELKSKCPDSHFYYFDVSFDETLKRHATKLNAHEFGEKEMREWWKEKDLLDFEGEKIIPEDWPAEKTVEEIKKETGL